MNSSSLFNNIYENDNYIRAIRDRFISDGSIDASAFKSNKGGVSVTRADTGDLDRQIKYMRRRFEGHMGVFPTGVCHSANIFEDYSPSLENANHWELYGSKSHEPLSLAQIKHIINNITLM